ncbi:hypothetical protein GCM10010140_64420 [Streptosporangium pseudovulgare]|uniref:Transposase n=1 Tax=Streptosporangium pseudovulgare TaxID=35765 RepID=A0ABQ2RDE1_9ACTN|nr:hypothetical protein GCM10010140_64420 [Streptosporangium pseudovulgare]
MDYFPWTSGLMVYLKVAFHGTIWRLSETEELYSFLRDWRERYFDNEAVQEAYAELWQCCQALADWLGEHGGLSDLPDDQESDDSVYKILGRADRGDDGWKEYDQVRNQGMDLADAVRASRRKVEKVGRARGL